ncbi:histidine phosphatase family protein [Pseudomonadota bacterium]
MNDYSIKLFLVRHGETEGNVDRAAHKRVADHAIQLTEDGIDQARQAGQFLADYFESQPEGELITPANTRLWSSPYKRARETGRHMSEYLGDFVGATREDIRLAEQQFGLFDGLESDEIAAQFPNEHQHYEKCKTFGGRFWARMPGGESRFDVALRVHDFFGTIQRDAEKHGIHNLIIVGHGVTNRAIVMRWLHLTPEWFEAEENPNNASIRQITGTQDRGYVFPGFPPSE